MKTQIANCKTPITNPLLCAVIAVLISGTATCLAADAPSISPTKENYLRIAAEVETNLQKEILQKFFPATVDEQGADFMKIIR